MAYVNQPTAQLAEYLADHGKRLDSRTEVGLPPVTKPGYPVPLVNPQEIIVHHTAGWDGDGTVPGEQQAWRDVAKLHFGYRWSQEAYTVAVGKTGRAYEGRGVLHQPGATGWPEDGRSHAIVLLGYYHPPYMDEMTDEQIETVRLIVTFLTDKGWAPQGNTGHRTYDATACPGQTVLPHLPFKVLRAPVAPKPPSLPTAPPIIVPPADQLVDNLRFWKPPQTRTLYYRPGNLMRGNDVAEYQSHANLTIGDPNTSGMKKWTQVDGVFGKDTDRITRDIQRAGIFFGFIPKGGEDGYAGQDTRHFVVVTMNRKGIW